MDTGQPTAQPTDQRWAFPAPTPPYLPDGRTPWQWVRVVAGWGLAVPGGMAASGSAWSLVDAARQSASCTTECWGWGIAFVFLGGFLAVGLLVMAAGVGLVVADHHRHRTALRRLHRQAARAARLVPPPLAVGIGAPVAPPAPRPAGVSPSRGRRAPTSRHRAGGHYVATADRGRSGWERPAGPQG